jgi:hypothetical protein
MDEPGEQRSDQERRDEVLGEIGDDDGQNLALAQRRGRLRDHVERDQHQRDPDQDTADLPHPASRALQEEYAADDQQDGDQPVQPRGQDLHHRGRAQIGAEQHRGRHGHGHDRARGEACGQQRDCRRALQQHGDARACERCLDPAALRPAEGAPEGGAARPFHSRADHPHRPEQQNDRAGEVKDKIG